MRVIRYISARRAISERVVDPDFAKDQGQFRQSAGADAVVSKVPREWPAAVAKRLVDIRVRMDLSHVQAGNRC